MEPSFALRTPYGKFWDGGVRRQAHRSNKKYPWTPQFHDKPIYWSDENRVERKWLKYELERQCGEPIPVLKLAKFVLTPIEVEQTEFTINFEFTVYERIKRKYGVEFCEAFHRVAEKCNGEREAITKFQYAFRKRGKTKELVAAQLPQAISYASVSFVNTETDLVFARMLLGTMFIESFDMTEMYKII